jgi:apolipoprotein N-acyltransferase
LINLSSDGTATSIAYSQLNVLPIIQIASITGILGITFLVTYIPSSIAVGWHYRKEKKKVLCIMGVTIVILISVFLFGMIRINGTSDKNTTNAGLVVLEERLHNITQHPDFEKEKMVAEYYAKEISDLALKGVQLVVLPERAINITKETENDIIGILSNTAKQNNVFIILGYTNFRNPKKYNSALVITSEGSVATDYNKVHLLKGFEDRIFTKGSDIGLFKFHRIQAGVAICKDLDFPDYIRNFGVSKVSFLVTPAWDFVKDDWLHSRMAVLRCVENGFSMIRTARLGRLTINDYCGRVTSEAKSSDGNKTTLTGKVLLERINTLYVRFGDWFVIVIAFAAIGFVFQGILRRRNNKQVKHDSDSEIST